IDGLRCSEATISQSARRFEQCREIRHCPLIVMKKPTGRVASQKYATYYVSVSPGGDSSEWATLLTSPARHFHFSHSIPVSFLAILCRNPTQPHHAAAHRFPSWQVVFPHLLLRGRGVAAVGHRQIHATRMDSERGRDGTSRRHRRDGEG